MSQETCDVVGGELPNGSPPSAPSVFDRTLEYSTEKVVLF